MENLTSLNFPATFTSLFTTKSVALIPLLLISFIIAQFTWSAFKASRSPLAAIPGPWYAFLTTIHLKYGFATGKIWKLVERSHKKYGPIVRLGPRQVWISDKEAMKQILSKIDLPKVAMYAEISRDRFSPGLFGEIRPVPHKRLKKFLSPAFTVGYIDNLESFFGGTIRDLLNKYDTSLSKSPQGNKILVDLMDDLHNVALDIMGECSFGRGFGQTNPAAEIEQGIREKVWKRIPRSIFDGLSKRYQSVYIKRFFRACGINIEFDWPKEMIMVSKLLREALARRAIDAVVQRRRTTDDSDRKDLLQHLIDEGKKPDTLTTMNTRDIVDQMSEILLAGSETTSGTTACLFLELARSPDKRAKLLDSLPVLDIGDEIISGKAVRNDPKYRYLNACIKEALRMHPIASEMGRRTGDQWVRLMGYNLPPHTVVSASYRDLHRNEEYFPKAMTFLPERFLEESERGDVPAADMDAYFPFSAGKHSCIGINFAWAEMRMIAANIFSRFDVIEVSGQDIDFRQFITMQFASGHWKAVLIPRKKASTIDQPE
ncbi:cytochrome P450 monooxygenase family 3 subfamily A [Fusarium subglutinans]|uniref:Cytochrome P450 monooxygenase family 3 subfamily A n=1 Tax=Gibberella subglutinans TaxID=42677 RepID=A0A8H5L5C6_GIBSU|nr:cytochrome P450 monooxygenase family 3 subfamily A [Fusarium subglutinans]KAF5585627.1 cytochrome P450 monooxygenase family 3 subfamily A [Fusarium subglutinans]